MQEQSIEVESRDHAKRIARRFISRSWWFRFEYQEGISTFTFSTAVDLERDLRAKLPGIRFDFIA